MSRPLAAAILCLASLLPAAAPALCNAIFAATGIRVRTLPIVDGSLKWS